MLPVALILVPLSCISSLGLLMRSTPTTNQCSLIQSWKSSGLISVFGYSYVLQFLLDWTLLVSSNYFSVRLREKKMKILLVKESYQNELIIIASMIIFQLNPGLHIII